MSTHNIFIESFSFPGSLSGLTNTETNRETDNDGVTYVNYHLESGGTRIGHAFTSESNSVADAASKLDTFKEYIMNPSPSTITGAGYSFGDDGQADVVSGSVLAESRFVRSNMAVRIYSISDTPTNMLSVITALDSLWSTVPGTTVNDTNLSLTLGQSSIGVNQPVNVNIVATHTSQSDLQFYQLYAPSGAFTRSSGQIVYTPDTAGTIALSVYRHNNSGNPGTATINLTVNPPA